MECKFLDSRKDFAGRCRRAASLTEVAFCQGTLADMAQIRQSRLDSGLVFQVKDLPSNLFKLFPLRLKVAFGIKVVHSQLVGPPADMAQIRQSRLDFGLVFQIKNLQPFSSCSLFARKWPLEPRWSTVNRLVHQWSRYIRPGGAYWAFAKDAIAPSRLAESCCHPSFHFCCSYLIPAAASTWHKTVSSTPICAACFLQQNR